MSVCVSVPKLNAVGERARACVRACDGRSDEAVAGAGGEQLKGIFSGLRGRAPRSNNFYECRSKPASPRSPLALDWGPAPVCLWYAVHVARLRQLSRAAEGTGP